MEADERLLGMEVLAGVMIRAGAAAELLSMGIDPSPADVEAWIGADNRTRRRLGLAWAIMSGSAEPEFKKTRGS